jgi:hypothetical protein
MSIIRPAGHPRLGPTDSGCIVNDAFLLNITCYANWVALFRGISTSIQYWLVVKYLGKLYIRDYQLF